MVWNIFAVSRYFIFIKIFHCLFWRNHYSVIKTKPAIMNTISFPKFGYNFFLEEQEDGYYLLKTDDVFPDFHLKKNENTGDITTVTKGEVNLITIGQTFQGKVIKEIVRIDSNPPAFKVKLENNKIWKAGTIFRLFLK